MTIRDVARHLESLSPIALQEDYDNCGLLVGDPDWNFHSALLCLDLTAGVLDEAISRGCNMVIAHHPVIFRGIKKLTPFRPETAMIVKAIKYDIALYSIHTNLDNTLHGLNAHVLTLLGTTNLRILRPMGKMLLKLVVFCPAAHAGKVRQAIFDGGGGQIGDYDCCSYNIDGSGTFRASAQSNPFVGKKNVLHTEPETRIEVILPRYLADSVVTAMIAAHPYEEVAYDLYPLENAIPVAGAGLIGELPDSCDELQFLQKVKVILDLPVIRYSGLTGRQVTQVAICTGTGGFLLGDAIRAGVDIFLTADLKYHEFFEACGRLLMADIGHYESERHVKDWLHAALIEKFPNFAFLISEVNTNPVHYL